MTQQQSYKILDALIEADACFAIFRPPHESTHSFVMQKTGTPSLIGDIEELNDQQGFVVAPFRSDKSSPIIVIRPDCINLEEVDIPSPIHSCKESAAPTAEKNEKESYANLFTRFHHSLEEGEFKKLVLSRSKTIDREEGFSPGRSFFTAAEKYPHSYVYLLHTPQSGTWLGSTPETLLAGANVEWQTVALAGTRYPHSGTVTWDDKNLREQHLVTSYLLRQLTSFHITPEINGPYTVKAGNLAHLRTDFSFTLQDTPKPGTLLKALHPTPAVSGLPKEQAYKFIQENEDHNRLYYSGFLGMLNTGGSTDLYVNLRCMKIEKKSLTLFAGSGLLASSTLEDEWEETQRKLEVMLHIAH